MQPNRWERLLDRKPVPILEHLLEEVARIFAADLRIWPPPLQDLDPVTGAKLALLLAGAEARPDPRLYREAFKLTRLDLSRELEAQEDYLRNQRWLEAGLTAKDKAMLLFLSRFMAEQLLALGEATGERITRSRLLDVLGRTERHLLDGAQA